MKKRHVYLLFLINLAIIILWGLFLTKKIDRRVKEPVAVSRGTVLDTVNTGTGANTGTGDPLRTAFEKLNDAVNLMNTIELHNVTSPIQTQLNARGRVYSDTMSVSAGILRTKATTITTEPYNIMILDSSGNDITHAIKDSVALNGGVYKLYVYSVDALTGCKLKILY